jgi:hypothetical protein
MGEFAIWMSGMRTRALKPGELANIEGKGMLLG